MQPGPDKVIDQQKLQVFVKNNFASIKQAPYEAGTCKRVFKLPGNIGLAVTHGNSGMEKDLIDNERVYLQYLKDQGFPVVEVHGEVFAVEGEGNQKRYGYLMNYIPNAVFIETKSPALLKAQIFAALLGIPTQPSEGWWGLNHARLLSEIAKRIKDPETFKQLKARAENLCANYKNLIKLLEKQQLAVSDLQIMVSKDGTLTIIDPLDVVKRDPVNKSIVSILNTQRPPDAGFRDFLEKTDEWLQAGLDLSHRISSAETADYLQHVISSRHDGLASGGYRPLMNNQLGRTPEKSVAEEQKNNPPPSSRSQGPGNKGS